MAWPKFDVLVEAHSHDKGSPLPSTMFAVSPFYDPLS